MSTSYAVSQELRHQLLSSDTEEPAQAQLFLTSSSSLREVFLPPSNIWTILPQ